MLFFFTSLIFYSTVPLQIQVAVSKSWRKCFEKYKSFNPQVPDSITSRKKEHTHRSCAYLVGQHQALPETPGRSRHQKQHKSLFWFMVLFMAKVFGERAPATARCESVAVPTTSTFWTKRNPAGSAGFGKCNYITSNFGSTQCSEKKQSKKHRPTCDVCLDKTDCCWIDDRSWPEGSKHGASAAAAAATAGTTLMMVMEFLIRRFGVG